MHSYLHRYRPPLILVCVCVYVFIWLNKAWTSDLNNGDRKERQKQEELTTIETLPDFESTTGGERSVQRGVVQACGRGRERDSRHVAATEETTRSEVRHLGRGRRRRDDGGGDNDGFFCSVG